MADEEASKAVHGGETYATFCPDGRPGRLHLVGCDLATARALVAAAAPGEEPVITIMLAEYVELVDCKRRLADADARRSRFGNAPVPS